MPPESKFTDHWSSTQPFASTASTLSIQVVISPAGDPHWVSFSRATNVGRPCWYAAMAWARSASRSDS